MNIREWIKQIAPKTKYVTDGWGQKHKVLSHGTGGIVIECAYERVTWAEALKRFPDAGVLKPMAPIEDVSKGYYVGFDSGNLKKWEPQPVDARLAEGKE